MGYVFGLEGGCKIGFRFSLVLIFFWNFGRVSCTSFLWLVLSEIVRIYSEELGQKGLG